MKRLFRALAGALPHGAISLAAAVLVLLVLEYFNPRMGFLTSGYSRIVIALLALFAMAAGIQSAGRMRRARRKRMERWKNTRRSR